MGNTLRCMVALLLMANAALAADASAGTPQKKYKGPVKVFILAGQSNMEGPANTNTFDYIGDDPATAPMLKTMRGAARACIPISALPVPDFT